MDMVPTVISQEYVCCEKNYYKNWIFIWSTYITIRLIHSKSNCHHFPARPDTISAHCRLIFLSMSLTGCLVFSTRFWWSLSLMAAPVFQLDLYLVIVRATLSLWYRFRVSILGIVGYGVSGRYPCVRCCAKPFRVDFSKYL